MPVRFHGRYYFLQGKLRTKWNLLLICFNNIKVDLQYTKLQQTPII